MTHTLPDNSTRPLGELFAFIQKHREWNEGFQKREYLHHLGHCKTPREKLVALLHHTVNTQQQPKMRMLASFWRALSQFKPSQPLSEVDLVEFLEDYSKCSHESLGSWHRLYSALKACDGWGTKTAALFVRNIFHVHRGAPELHFWNDVNTKAFQEKDRILLPVDEVILTIFKEIGSPPGPDFDSLNELLLSHYSQEEMLLWDDLWFWGHFTQTGNGGARTMGWNSDKFWCQQSSSTWSEGALKKLGEEFVRLVKAESKRLGQSTLRV
jgi:hypothetical protein